MWLKVCEIVVHLIFFKHKTCKSCFKNLLFSSRKSKKIFYYNIYHTENLSNVFTASVDSGSSKVFPVFIGSYSLAIVALGLLTGDFGFGLVALNSVQQLCDFVRCKKCCTNKIDLI